MIMATSLSGQFNYRIIMLDALHDKAIQLKLLIGDTARKLEFT